MAENDKEEKKIIVDEDWKTQAQKEKEVLKKEEELEHKAEEEQERPSLPEADFPGLLSMITTQAYYAMGLIGTEEDKEHPPDLAIAKYNIDTLGIIEEKTKGNLSKDEAKLLESTLHQLRMIFVQLSEQGG